MISVIIPVYNEEKNLCILYERLVKVLNNIKYSWELIFIDDGSIDGSRQIIDGLAEKNKNVKAIHFKRNLGQTAALTAGFDFSQGDIVIPMDADLQNDPEDIPLLLEKIEEGYDAVSGWRKYRKDHPIKRNLVSKLANILISQISGVHLHDYGCSLKAYRKEIIKEIKLYGEMHRFIPIYASWLGAKITEIPVRHHRRLYGTSKYGMERVLKVLFDLAVIKFLYRYDQKPMYIFGGAGVSSLGLSFLFAVWALYIKIFKGISFILTPLPLLVVLTMITGMMCILMGFLAELTIRTYYESQDKPTYLVSYTKNATNNRRR